MRSPILDFFHILPEMVFRQAFTVIDARIMTPTGPCWFVIFGRYAKSLTPPDGVCVTGDGGFHGVQVVAYRCDEYGVVENWERRYEAFGIEPDIAVRSLRLQIANGAATFCNYEGMLQEQREILDNLDPLEIGDDFLSSL